MYVEEGTREWFGPVGNKPEFLLGADVAPMVGVPRLDEELADALREVQATLDGGAIVSLRHCDLDERNELLASLAELLTCAAGHAVRVALESWRAGQ